MKEYYGVRDLHPLDYPIKSYDEQMTECRGMYDCPSHVTHENFSGHNSHTSGQMNWVNWLNWNEVGLLFLFLYTFVLILNVFDDGRF